MVWGYRRQLPGNNFPTRFRSAQTTKAPSRDTRRAFEICNAAPGVVIVPDTKVQVKDFSKLGVGDLVFFDADESDGTRLTISECISDWMLEIIIGSFRVVKGLTVRHWATTKGNPFLTGLGYTHAPSAR